MLAGCAAETGNGADSTTTTDTTFGSPDTEDGTSSATDPTEGDDGLVSPQSAGGSIQPDTASADGTAASAKRAVPWRGVNLNGADFGSALPGTFGRDYTFPTNAEVDYYVGKGMNLFRIGFVWERLQPTAYGAFDTTYANRLYSIVAYARSKGARVTLNPQNFARYYGNTIGSTAVPNAVFANFWGKLSAHYATDNGVMFGLVNEPNSMPTEQWVSGANAAIVAIRATSAKNVIIVPGNAWTGAWSWNHTDYGTSNAVAMLNIVDSGNNMYFEAHQYLDQNGGGQSGTCIGTTVGADRLVPFVTWLRAHGRKGIIGEFAGGANATCNTAITNMLSYVMASSDVLMGFSWWGGGPWWSNGYPFVLDPQGTMDRPQMAVIKPFL